MIDFTLLNRPRFPLLPAGKRTKDRSVYGFDTETDRGRCSLIASSDGDYKICEKRMDAFDFLMQKRFLAENNFFWNLEYDTNAIIKWLEPWELSILAFQNHLTTFEGIYISIIPKKGLTIGKRSSGGDITRSVTFYDAANFYNKQSLVNAFFNTFKKEYKKRVDAKIKENFPAKEISNKEILYCIEDARICQLLSKHLVINARRLMDAKKFISPASLAKQYMREHLNDNYMPSSGKYNHASYKTFAGGRFECLKRGSWKFDRGEQLFLHDINSCYPYMMSQLPKISENQWYLTDDITNDFYGFYLCNILVNPCIISPIHMWLDSPGLRIYPDGIIQHIWLTAPELKALWQNGHEVDIKYGWSNPGLDELMFPYVDRLYKERMRLKKAGDPLEMVIKLVLNSMYGCMIETRDKKIPIKTLDDEDEDPMRCSDPDCGYYVHGVGEWFDCPICGGELESFRWEKKYSMGAFFNPAIASYITALSRVKLYNDSIKMADNIVLYATDSITFDKKPHHLKIGGKLGEYDECESFEGLVIGSGVYTLKNDDSIKFALRGFERVDIGPFIEDGEPDFDSIMYKKRGPVKLKESEKYKTKVTDEYPLEVYSPFEKLNQFVDKNKVLSLNFDRKRIWEKDHLTIKDIISNNYKSKPIRCMI